MAERKRDFESGEWGRKLAEELAKNLNKNVMESEGKRPPRKPLSPEEKARRAAEIAADNAARADRLKKKK
jgi:hypothetical protein